MSSCPFCNNTEIKTWRDVIHKEYRACCSKCSALGPPALDEKEALEKWHNQPGIKRLHTKIEHLEFEKNRLYDRTLKAEQMLWDQYAGKISQEDVFEYVQERLEKMY